MKNMTILISFGKEQNYLFENVKIDEKFGYPIYGDGKLVGGILFINKLLKNKWKWVQILGIEIKKEFRRQGLAKSIISKIKEENDIIDGVIVNDCIDFWLSNGAKLKEIPMEMLSHIIAKGQDKDIEIKTPLWFYITKEPELSEYYEMIMKNLKKYENNRRK